MEGTMFTNQSYQDVLSENGSRDNIVGSAWLMVVTLGALILLLA
jgi:hypothetical protein